TVKSSSGQVDCSHCRRYSRLSITASQSSRASAAVMGRRTNSSALGPADSDTSGPNGIMDSSVSAPSSAAEHQSSLFHPAVAILPVGPEPARPRALARVLASTDSSPALADSLDGDLRCQVKATQQLGIQSDHD